MPGVVDPHVHIEDHFSVDTYETGTAAAALGGVTTYIDFAWQHWVGELSNYDEEGTLMDGLAEKQRKGERAIVDYSVHAAITREDPAVLDELETLVEEGVTSFKMFTAYEIGLGYGFMKRVLDRLADLDAVGVFHTEDASVPDVVPAVTPGLRRGDGGERRRADGPGGGGEVLRHPHQLSEGRRRTRAVPRRRLTTPRGDLHPLPGL
jgi:dihydropyrimidinase